MLKKVLKVIVLVLMTIGIILGISITVKKQLPQKNQKVAENKIFNMIQSKSAEIINFYTYGKAFNLSGKISNVNKDNFESAKLVITDGLDYEETYALNYSFEENNLIFSSDNEINSGIILDKLDNSEYYVFLRLKLNNSIDPKYYSFENHSEFKDFDYYSITSENTNKKASISFNEKNYKNKTYKLLTINVNNSELPENVYDIVIDAGHGGKDSGERSGKITEADITLEYAKSLKESLEQAGYKVKLTRDDDNTDSYTYTNMYDDDGRISIACSSKAKLMISLHVNNGASNLTGFEIYCPCKSNLQFAENMANKINENSNIKFSNSNSFKISDGVYLRNFTNAEIREFASTANKKGYEPYNITKNTPYLYTIREVGGIATGAYVDGRNTAYSANNYYKINQGIECYQIELGYIKNDINVLTTEIDNCAKAITEAICNNY